MSSRALRKLQKQRELEAQLQSPDDLESSDDEATPAPPKPKVNAFDLLNAADDNDDDDDAQSSETETAKGQLDQLHVDVPVANTQAKSAKKNRRKKKKKPAQTTVQKPSTESPSGKKEEELDDIDRALRELSVQNGTATKGDQRQSLVDVKQDSTAQLLAIEPKSLNAINEMRKLFGNVVLESFEEQSAAGSGRRRDRQREMVDLGKALSGRHSPASRGQSLAGVTMRKNILMQGKDEWPRTTSGGLGMELVQKTPDGSSLYRLVHNKAYQDVQLQFDMCVESMDPQRLIHLLQYNPYHISTLLQVSEIAKHQGDHAVSADLLERSLFNIGRAAHSSFNNQLQEGKAKLDFVLAENRELWLTIWRYIANLGMKGTWRTAYEWAKLILSLETKDPYCIRLLIDHLALRGRQYEHFISLCTETTFKEDWKSCPNIQCSLSLAYLRLNKPKEARQQLRESMSRYPWIFSRLAQELDVQPIPRRIWGKMPPAQSHELLTELYIARAKDLWNTPEVLALLVEVAETLSEEPVFIEPPEINLDIARHVVLSDVPSVTTHLPTRFTTGRISASDPLPPYESEAYRQQSNPVPSYISQIPDTAQPQWLRNLLERVNPPDRDDADDDNNTREEDHPNGSSQEPSSEGIVISSPPPREDQGAVREWLLGAGVAPLRQFIHQHGIDPGNWDDIEPVPVNNYVDGLIRIYPFEQREELLYGPIQDVLGEMVVELIEWQGQMRPEYWEHPSE